MIVIFIEIIILLILSKKIRQLGFKNINKWMIILLYFQLIILIIYRYELNLIGRKVYWSDAEYYWNATIDFMNGTLEYVNNIGYIYYSYLIQKTSPIIWVGFNNISNILVYDISILTVVILLLKEKITKKSIKFFMIIIAYNPLITYALLRNLKDTLFLLYTILIIYCCHCICILENKKFKYYIFIIILTLLNQDIRPWAFVVTIVCFIIIGVKTLKFNIKSFIFIGISLVMIMLILGKFSGHLTMWLPILLDRVRGLNIISILIGPFKILVGPGPIRSILGQKYFMYYTISGNIFCFIGSVMWWTGFAYLISCVSIKKRLKNNLSLFFYVILLIFLIIYTMAYGGSTELRFRGISYLFLIISIITTFDINFVKNIKFKYKFILILILTYSIGTIFSL